MDAHRIRALVRHYLHARTRFRLHSPFAYELACEVLDDDRHYYAFDEIAHLYQRLRKSREPIELIDRGAGSRRASGRRTTVGTVFRTAGSSLFFYKFLFRLVRHFRPATILELGTNLGLSALSMHRAAPRARLITIEGCPNTAAFAKRLFAERQAEIEVMEGLFEHALPRALETLGQVDFAFIDGDHRKEATLNYFHALLPYTHSRSILFFDDIYWSADMAQAWASIQAHPSVRFTADFFFGGLVSFRKEQVVPLHLQMIPRRFKPWQMGFVE